MTDEVVLGALITCFALFVTLHVCLCFALAVFDKPRWRGAVGFVLPPLAPAFGFAQGRKKLAVGWILSLAAYTAIRITIAFL